MASLHLGTTVPLLLLSLLTISPSAIAKRDSTFQSRSILKRSNTVTTASSLDGQTFDYVIVGGGTAGLAMAAKLSSNNSLTVAVIEAGTDGSAVAETSILPPAQAYFDGIANLTSAYDWHYQTSAQSELDGRQIYWPRGKVLGGSSAVNGLYMTRASEIEHNSWASLLTNGAAWTWNSIYPFMKDSETWTAPSAANVALGNMVLDPSFHGTSGPIDYSFPGFFYPQVAAWVPTFANLGIGTRDPGGGETWDSYIVTSAIDPSSWSRSYSKTGYLDPAASRSNLVVLTGFQATKIVFSGTTATGVSFAASATGTVYTVNARQEVILSAGVIGTPQLLQVSGVGDSALLTPLGIPVVVDLPGVGMQLTDHLSGELVYSTTAYQTGDEIGTNATFAAAQMAEWVAGDPNSLYNSPNDAIAYINLTSLFGAGPAATLLSEIKANQTTLVAAYSTNSLVQAGYNATYTAEVDDIYTSPVGQAEILMANTGSYNAFPTAGNTISIQAAIQHPLSRGSVKITSKSTFISPTIDPGYFTHPADIQILREAFKYARIAGQTQPLAALLTTELSPGPSVSTDAEWETWIRSAVSTEYHPAGTCSMLPEALGGVIDEELRVYGTLNLRIVDSSIVPISMSAHMTAPLYGISENAYNIIIPSGTTTTTSTTTSSTSTSSSTSKAKASSTTTSSSPSSSSSGTSSQNKPSAAVGSLQVGVIASVLAMGLACVGIW